MANIQGFCCEKCFDNEEIATFIREGCELDDCPYCGSRNVAVRDTESVGEFIKAGLRRAYEVADVWAVREGFCSPKSVYEILCEDQCIFSDHLLNRANLHEELLAELMEAGLDIRAIQQGSDRDLEFQDIYADLFIEQGELYGAEATEVGTAWDIFKYTCRYYNRFFDISGKKASRKGLLDTLGAAWRQMEKRCPAGTVLYRMRTKTLSSFAAQSELEQLDAYREVGPVPYTKVKNNRMSPAGISYLYLASDSETCAKETRISDGQFALLGQFTTKRPLLLLDLTTKNVRSQTFDPGSIFEEEYDPGMVWIQDFLLQFASEISKPISEADASLEYVPTQLLAEYVRMLDFDGIVFDSSVNPDGKSYVLFYGPIDPPPQALYAGYRTLTKYTDVLKLTELSYTKVELTPSVDSLCVRSSIPEPEAEGESERELVLL